MQEKISKNIDEYPVQVRFPVAYGEMDFYQHVNNVNYFRYFENARAKYFEELGIWEMRINAGKAAVLAEAKCKYLQSLFYPDNLIVGARVRSVGQTSFIQEYLIVSEKLGVAAVGEGILVMYDFNKSEKIRVPEEIREAIEKVEQRLLNK